MEKQTTELEEEVCDLAQQLQEAKEANAHDTNSINVKLEEKSEQLSILQEKARLMMMEKDEEIQQLKSRLHLAEANVSGSTTTIDVDPIHTPNQEHVSTRNLLSDSNPASTSYNRENAGATPGDTPFRAQSDGQEGWPTLEEIIEDSGSDAFIGSRALSLPVDSTVGSLIPSPKQPRSARSIEESDQAKHIRRLEEEVRHLQQEIEDSERTHALRDKANQVLKEEIAALQRSTSRDNLDVAYLKNVLVSAFENGTLPRDSPMVEVLGRLLFFSPDEFEKIRKARLMASKATPTNAPQQGFFGWTR